MTAVEKIETKEIELCFNCGSNEHTLKNCNQPRDKNGKLKFANCFICKRDGHIARDCPENANGLYPNGGCCHICLQKTHLVKDCPERTEEDKEMYRLKKMKEEDEKNGIRINGLTDDSYKGGDDILLDNNDDYNNDDDNNDNDNDNDNKKKKKSKKRKNLG